MVQCQIVIEVKFPISLTCVIMKEGRERPFTVGVKKDTLHGELKEYTLIVFYPALKVLIRQINLVAFHGKGAKQGVRL